MCKQVKGLHMGSVRTISSSMYCIHTLVGDKLHKDVYTLEQLLFVITLGVDQSLNSDLWGVTFLLVLSPAAF